MDIEKLKAELYNLPVEDKLYDDENGNTCKATIIKMDRDYLWNTIIKAIPLEAGVIKKNGGQEEPPFDFMTAELINDDDLQYGNRVRKYWRITCEDWRDTEIEKKFILDARSFPEGTTIVLRIPEEKLNQRAIFSL